jgi:5-methyltetrahydrofolate--homocysteine methyltransferase
MDRLAAGEVLVGDGAVGTLLMARGLETGACPESWNLTQPEVQLEIAREYLEAGAMLVQTNTFGGSPLKLSQYGLADRTEEINEAAVRSVQAAVRDRAYVCGSCGPCGKTLQPYGEADPEEVAVGFARQLAALIRAGVDVICVETMTDLREAGLAIKAAKSLAPEVPVLATMTFDETPRGFFTVMGVDVPAAVRGLREAGADVVGSNCGNGCRNMVKIAREFREQSDLPLIIQSNAGLPELVGGEVVYPETPEFMAACAKEMVSAGVGIVGGCCGTTPAHIAAIRKAICPSP